jgi:SAM-dependent methyltransferase
MSANNSQNAANDTAAPSRPCPVCGGASAALHYLALIVPEDFSLQREFSINSCNYCGAAFHDVAPQTDRDSYYESYTGADSVDYQVTPDQARLNDFTVEFLQHLALTSKDLSIADIGCSFGVTLLALQQRGYTELYAMDPDHAAIRYLTQKGISGRTGFATDAFPELENKFDVILLRHVLEHLYAPRKAIENVSKWLKPGGRLYIELPDLSRFQEAGAFPGFFFEYEHINHFSLPSLLNLMRGFKLAQYESTADIYPCMRAVFERSDWEQPVAHNDSDAHFVRDCLIRPNEKGQAALENIEQLGTSEVALWGVSTFVHRLLTHTPLKRCNIVHMVDRNRQLHGKKLLGCTIAPPDTLAGFEGTIVIGGENSASSIEKAIRDMGLNNRIVFLMHR